MGKQLSSGTSIPTSAAEWATIADLPTYKELLYQQKLQAREQLMAWLEALQSRHQTPTEAAAAAKMERSNLYKILDRMRKPVTKLPDYTPAAKRKRPTRRAEDDDLLSLMTPTQRADYLILRKRGGYTVKEAFDLATKPKKVVSR